MTGDKVDAGLAFATDTIANISSKSNKASIVLVFYQWDR